MDKNAKIASVLIGVSMLAGGAAYAPEQSVASQVQGKPYSEYAEIKAEAVVGKTEPHIYEDAERGLVISIFTVEKIDKGVQVYARAWKDGEQLGFGSDGTVDLERFRFFNPPTMVPDGTTHDEVIDGVTVPVSNLREDPQAALEQALSEAVYKIGRNDTQIVEGSVGHTTSTFFPSLDGRAQGAGAGGGTKGNWTVTRAAPGTVANNSESQGVIVRFNEDSTVGQFADLRRGFILFDTSALGTDTISAATFSFTSPLGVTDGQSDSLALVQSTTASDSSIAASDFEGTNGNVTKQATSLTLASIVTDDSTYNDMALNATGIANISGSGVTHLGLKSEFDLANSPAPVSLGLDSTITLVWMNNSEVTGTSRDPKLVVVHTAAATPAPVIPSNMMMELLQ